MDLYFAGAEAFGDILKDEAFNVLMSYYYIKNSDKLERVVESTVSNKIFIDSGAFTAWTKGSIINVDEYIEWINNHSEHISLYGQIDVIPGDRVKGHTQEQVKEAARATWENYLYMRPKMKNPEGLLYTFHVWEPFEYLQKALEWADENGKHIPYIAFGGMVGKSMPVKKSFLDRCFKIIKASSNPDVKVHAFGMTSFSLLSEYPITSADSTSWIMTGANGGIMTDMGTIDVSEQNAKFPNHWSHLDNNHLKQINTQLKEYGFTLDELSTDYRARLKYHLRYMYNKALNLKQAYKPKKSLF